MAKAAAKKDHPLAAQFPMMSALEYEGLKVDIARNGLKEPILLFEGKILDGRNRYRACIDEGVKPRFREFRGSRQEAQELSASFNLSRRHLSKSQKAMVIAKHGLAMAPGSERNGGTTIRDAGQRYGVNHQTIYKAFFVCERDPKLADQVLAGKLSVGKAEAQLRDDDTDNEETPATVQGRFTAGQLERWLAALEAAKVPTTRHAEELQGLAAELQAMRDRI